MTPRRALWWLIGVSTLLRLAWAAGLGPGNDEAYHYLFTVHRDWSYFDHPPMLAVVEMLGMAMAGGSASTFGLRLGFIALFAGSTWLMAGLTSRFYGPRAGFLAAFALNVSAYYTAAAGTFALPDGPLLFFWLLTLDRLARALEAPRGLWPWVAVGLAWGGALLSKYHAVFLPVGALLYLADRALGAILAAEARPVPGRRRRPGGLLARDRLERRPWVGLVRLPGGAGPGAAPVPARRPRDGPARAGGLSASPGCGGRWWRSWSSACAGPSGAVAAGRSVPALPGGRAPGGLRGGGVHAPGPAALDARRLPLALPDAGPVVGRSLGGRPRSVPAPAGDPGRAPGGDRRRC